MPLNLPIQVSPAGPLIATQILAALLALVVAAGLCGLGIRGARLVARLATHDSGSRGQLDHVAMAYVVLMIVCATLALRTWFDAPWIEWVILAGLVPGVFSFGGILPRLRTRKWHWLAWVALAVLVIDVLYAALPLYRYDQWTYHLLVAKWISLEGTLTPPVTYDHIFFTGNYEFLGLLARAMSASDTFQQGFQNSLSLLLVALPAMMMFLPVAGDKQDNTDAKRPGLFAAVVIAYALLIIFNSGDHEALINSKPDYVLMMSSLTILAFAMGGTRLVNPFLVGFLLAGGTGFKITWLHFAACSPVILWRCLTTDAGGRAKSTRTAVLLVAGCVIALPCVLPWAIKNWQFFGNPLHPAQSPIWHSTMWDDAFESYWKTVAAKPSGLRDFLVNEADVIRRLPERWGMIALPLLAILLLTRGQNGNSLPGQQRTRITRAGWLALAACLMIYVTAWGVFYKASIFNRFVAPAFAFPLLVAWWTVRALPARSWAVVASCFLIPVAANAQLEVSIPRIARSAVNTWNEYASGYSKGPMEKVPDLLEIGRDRTARFPGVAFTKATLFSDFPFNYYGPSAFWIAGDVVTAWQMRAAGVDPDTGDGMEFLRKMDIRYVWIVHPDKLDKIPPAIIKSLPRLRIMPSRLGTLYTRD